MHKHFLTKPECEIIEGSEKIISVFGGFPSMENGTLIDFTVEPNVDNKYLIDVFLLFDIKGWKRWSGYYSVRYEDAEPYDDKPNLISLRFEGARDIIHSLETPSSSLIDIYFSNTTDIARMFRAGNPRHPVVIPRPYCSFYLASRRLIIIFSEDECRVSADWGMK